MNLRIAINGTGVVNSFGDSISDMSLVYSSTFGSIKDLSGSVSGDGNRLSRSKVDTSPLSEYLPKRSLRRIDHFSRMALLSAGKAIKDTDPSLFSKENTGVIIATGFGALQTTFAFLDSYIEKGDKLASPIHFSNSVHNAAAAHVSIAYGITGPNLTISQLDMSFFSALITAGAWLETGKVGAVLLGTSDAFCDVLGYCIDKFFCLKEKALEYSFGEGSAFFFLTREESKSEYGYFDDISIGNYKNTGLDIPPDTLLVLSPSAIDTCNDEFMSYLKNNNKALYRNHLFSPTDCSMDMFFSTKVSKKICYVKIGQNGEYGKIIITPSCK